MFTGHAGSAGCYIGLLIYIQDSAENSDWLPSGCVTYDLHSEKFGSLNGDMKSDLSSCGVNKFAHFHED